jgi:hypothetical protein
MRIHPVPSQIEIAVWIVWILHIQTKNTIYRLDLFSLDVFANTRAGLLDLKASQDCGRGNSMT